MVAAFIDLRAGDAENLIYLVLFVFISRPILRRSNVPLQNGEQTTDHMLHDCELVEQETDRLKDAVLRSENWSVSNDILISKYINPFKQFTDSISLDRPPLWSSGQSFCLQMQWSRVRFPALPVFLSSSGSGTGSTQPREVN